MIGKKCTEKTTYTMRKISSFTITFIVLLASLTAAIIFIPSAAKADAQPPSAATYYFDSAGILSWETNASYMYDGNENNYASTTSSGDVEDLTRNTCPGTDLGTITKVELRLKGYNAGLASDWLIRLRPRFGVAGSYGAYQDYTPTESAAWSSYFDITDDPDGPGTWSWSDVANLCCWVYSSWGGKVNNPVEYCSKVEIRVTYTPPSLEAIVDWGDENKIAGASYVITANASTGTITNYTWNLGNGTFIYGQSWVRVNYGLMGRRTINLTISNSKGERSYAEEEVITSQYISLVVNSNNNGVNYITWGNGTVEAEELARD